MVLLVNIVFNFHSGFSITTTFLLLKCIPHAKYEKNPTEIPVSLFFFTTLNLIWPKFCPKDHTNFTFFE